MAFVKINDTDSSNKNYYSDEESDDDLSPLVIHKRDKNRALKANGEDDKAKWSETHHHQHLPSSSSSSSAQLYSFLFIFLVLATVFFCYVYNGGCTKSLLFATVFGSSVTVFTWMLIYHDSKKPGLFPSTPLSPRNIREKSGHTFHFNYVVAILNGVICFSIALYKHMAASHV